MATVYVYHSPRVLLPPLLSLFVFSAPHHHLEFTTLPSTMKLVILKDYDAISDYAAEYVVKRINDFAPTADRLFVLGLPTGSTPLGMYQRLVAMNQQGKVSFKFVRTFNMDEYVDIPRSHPQSYHSFMYDNFFRHLDIDPANVNIPNGENGDLTEECLHYEEAIAASGGVELFIGGIGSDGHVAFNEAGSSLTGRTHIQVLHPDTIEANSRFFGNDTQKVPKRAITVGVGTIMDAREVMILANGAHKALAVNKAVEAGVSHQWTASALAQLHPKALFVVDDPATLELKVKTVRYFKGIQQQEEEEEEEKEG